MSNDEYCPILSYTMVDSNGNEFETEDHYIISIEGQQTLIMTSLTETFEDPDEGPEFLQFQIIANTITQTNNEVFNQVNYCDELSQIIYLSDDQLYYFFKEYNLLKNTDIEMLLDVEDARGQFYRADDERCKILSYQIRANSDNDQIVFSNDM